MLEPEGECGKFDMKCDKCGKCGKRERTLTTLTRKGDSLGRRVHLCVCV
jgi:hypothetical protein